MSSEPLTTLQFLFIPTPYVSTQLTLAPFSGKCQYVSFPRSILKKKVMGC